MINRREPKGSALDAYLENIGRIPMMTPEEEIHLGKLVRRMMALKEEDRPLTRREKMEVLRGERAKNRFVQANLRLVVYIVKRNNRRTSFLETLDLIQECTLGLVRAVEMFDPQRGYKFSTYAYWWCRQAINGCYVSQERAIRRPVSVGEMAARVEKAMHVMSARLGRTPTIEEIAEAAGTKTEEIELLATRGSHCVSLDTPAGDTDASSLLQLIYDEDGQTADDLFDTIDDSKQVRQALKYLPLLSKQEQDFITRRFGLNGQEPEMFADIARELNITRERARQITKRGLLKLRSYLVDGPPSAVNTTEPKTEPPKEVRRPCSRRTQSRKLIAQQVLQTAREAWSSPTLQSA